MTYTLYPHPPYYFVTLSKLTESRFFFNHPPTFSDNVTLYHVFFLTASLSQLGRICYVTLVNIVMLDQKNQDSYVIWVILVISQSIKVSQDRLIKLDWIGQGRIKEKEKKNGIFRFSTHPPPLTEQDDSPKGNSNGHKTDSEGVPYLANRPKFWRFFFWKIFFSKEKFLAKFLLRGNKNLGGDFFYSI